MAKQSVMSSSHAYKLVHLELNDNSRWYPDCPIAIIGKLLDLGKVVNLMMKKLELISDKLS